MTWERAGRLAWIAPALTAAVGAGFLTIVPQRDADGVEAAFVLVFVAYAAVGALIASRLPRHPVGWLLAAVGLSTAVSELLYAYGGRPAEPGAPQAAWVAGWFSEPSTVAIVFLLLLFPTGRFASRRWRAAGLASLAGAVAWALTLALRPGPMAGPAELENPYGVQSAAWLLDPLAEGGLLLFAAFLVVGAGGAISRFRHARGIERRQTKWLALSAATLLAMLALQVTLLAAVDTDAGVWDLITSLIFCVGLVSFPVAAAVAILREGLYDIDVVIRRTLVYGALTTLLAGTYLGLVLLAGLAVGESDLAVAAATLAVAALFRPARARIQAAVDRRFYRRRYDAGRTVEAFAGRLRDELDLEAVGADLRRAVRDTVQPAHVSLWLRGGR